MNFGVHFKGPRVLLESGRVCGFLVLNLLLFVLYLLLYLEYLLLNLLSLPTDHEFWIQFLGRELAGLHVYLLRGYFVELVEIILSLVPFFLSHE